MRVGAWDHFGISAPKILLISAAAAFAAATSTGLLAAGVLGGALVPTIAIVGALVFYSSLTTPRRILDSMRASQARDAVTLFAAARAAFAVTGSRPRTLLQISPKERELASAVDQTRRNVLLGHLPKEAVGRVKDDLASNTASRVLEAVASLKAESFDMGDDEVRGLTHAAELVRETRLPMFMTVCFFAPIMIVLYAVFSKTYGLQGLAELAALEFIAIDLAFYLSSPDKGRV